MSKTVPAPVRTPPAPPAIPEPLLSGIELAGLPFLVVCIVFAIGVALRWW